MAVSGRPTILKEGNPLATSTSTSTRNASTPKRAALHIFEIKIAPNPAIIFIIFNNEMHWEYALSLPKHGY